jgi:hypothetical protein
MMELFSIIYDPSTSSPFALVVEKAGGEKTTHGLTSFARSWAETKSSKPEGMVSTPFAPLTKSAYEAISGAISGDVYLSLDDIREHTTPLHVHAERKINKNVIEGKTSRPNMLNMTSGDKVSLIDYLANRFVRSSTAASAAKEAKSFNLCFNAKSNSLHTSQNSPETVWKADSLGNATGRGMIRRIGTKVNSFGNKEYSDNNRINRRVKSLIGNIEVDISDKPTMYRIDMSWAERFRTVNHG